MLWGVSRALQSFLPLVIWDWWEWREESSSRLTFSCKMKYFCSFLQSPWLKAVGLIANLELTASSGYFNANKRGIALLLNKKNALGTKQGGWWWTFAACWYQNVPLHWWLWAADGQVSDPRNSLSLEVHKVQDMCIPPGAWVWQGCFMGIILPSCCWIQGLSR